MTHTTCYEMKYLNWPPQEGQQTSQPVLNRIKEYPAEDAEFCGLYGYNNTFMQAGFLGDSKRFYVTPS